VNLLPLLAALALAQSPAATAAAKPTPDEAYGRAMSLLLDGRFPEAALAFDSLAADPSAPADVAQRARALAEASRALDERGRFLLRVPPLTPPASAGQPTGATRLDRSGRGELALYATAYGIWTGIAAGVLADSDDPKLYVGLALAGGGGGLALSVLGTRGRPIPDGRTQAIEAAGNWGSLNGGLVAGLLDSSTQGAVAATLGTGVAAIAGTVALTSRRSPSSGDVAIATSGAMWGLVTGGFALALVGDDDPDEKAVLGTLLGATDAGLLTMALAARRIEISRGRSLLIDAGGVVGALAGLSVPFFLESENPRAYGAAGLGGMAAGLGAAVVLTRGWDADEDVRSEAGPRTFPFVVPAPAGAAGAGGGGLLAGLRGTF
jgi:hypothetical protein